jgi:hypothetical protein
MRRQRAALLSILGRCGTVVLSKLQQLFGNCVFSRLASSAVDCLSLGGQTNAPAEQRPKETADLRRRQQADASGANLTDGTGRQPDVPNFGSGWKSDLTPRRLRRLANGDGASCGSDHVPGRQHGLKEQDPKA